MSDMMRAGILQEPGVIRCERIPKPEPNEGEVLVAVRKAGVCGSDLHRFLHGVPRYNFRILGHEFAGEVAEVGPGVDGVQPGDAVAVNPDLPCGHCPYCRVAEYALCEGFLRLGTRTDGGFAEFVRVPAQNLLPLPPGVDFEKGAMLEPAATALHTVIRGEIFPGDIAVVMGCGCIGCLIGQELQILGAGKVFVVDIVTRKLDIAAQVGLKNLINARAQDPVATVMDDTRQRGADVVFESAGATVVLNQAVHLTRKLGRLALLGLINEDVVLSQEAYSRVVRGELNLRGVFGNEYKPFPASASDVALDYVSQGRLPVTPLITHRYSNEKIDEAFALMRDHRDEANKIMFDFS